MGVIGSEDEICFWYEFYIFKLEVVGSIEEDLWVGDFYIVDGYFVVGEFQYFLFVF